MMDRIRGDSIVHFTGIEFYIFNFNEALIKTFRQIDIHIQTQKYNTVTNAQRGNNHGTNPVNYNHGNNFSGGCALCL